MLFHIVKSNFMRNQNKRFCSNGKGVNVQCAMCVERETLWLAVHMFYLIRIGIYAVKHPFIIADLFPLHKMQFPTVAMCVCVQKKRQHHAQRRHHAYNKYAHHA